MSVIDIKIQNTLHHISCEEGEEERLRFLATKFEDRIRNLIETLPNCNEKTLYLIASLILLDELEEKTNSSLNSNKTTELITEIFEALTRKIELLTEKVEKF